MYVGIYWIQYKAARRDHSKQVLFEFGFRKWSELYCLTLSLLRNISCKNMLTYTEEEREQPNGIDAHQMHISVFYLLRLGSMLSIQNRVLEIGRNLSKIRFVASLCVYVFLLLLCVCILCALLHSVEIFVCASIWNSFLNVSVFAINEIHIAHTHTHTTDLSCFTTHWHFIWGKPHARKSVKSIAIKQQSSMGWNVN